MQKTKIEKIRFWLLEALIIFLPFSAWLVSLTGRPGISTVRDVLTLSLFLFSLPFLRLKNLRRPLFLSIFLFIVLIFLSYFWVQASPLQWIKGVRFSAIPMLLLLILISSEFSEREKTAIVKTSISTSLIIIVVAILEFFGIKMPTLSALSGTGALDSFHLVGAADIHRLSSILAGPNALGLYLLTTIAYLIGWQDEIKGAKWLVAICSIVLLLTFSRSAWLGLVVLFLSAAIIKYKLSFQKISYLVILLIVLAGGSFYFSKKSATLSQIISHGISTDLRAEQYQRIAKVKSDIGLLGRGAGGAGPSTQNRLDHGPNYWTENTYLDTFEEFGLIGVILFMTIILLSFREILRNSKNNAGKTAAILVPSFAIAGIFINFYTGQVGFFMVIIAIGLISRTKTNEE